MFIRHSEFVANSSFWCTYFWVTQRVPDLIIGKAKEGMGAVHLELRCQNFELDKSVIQ